MRCAFALFLFLSAFAAGGFSQPPNKDKAQNLRNCVAGFGECLRAYLAEFLGLLSAGSLIAKCSQSLLCSFKKGKWYMVLLACGAGFALK
jgi:hypothetical protein